RPAVGPDGCRGAGLQYDYNSCPVGGVGPKGATGTSSRTSRCRRRSTSTTSSSLGSRRDSRVGFGNESVSRGRDIALRCPRRLQRRNFFACYPDQTDTVLDACSLRTYALTLTSPQKRVPQR